MPSSFAALREVVYLDYETVVEVNLRVGGPGAGVLNADGIHSALGRPLPVFGEEVYPELWDKAAALLHAIGGAQHFREGNKRTAYVCAVTFLSLNGIHLRPVLPAHSYAFVLAACSAWMELNEVADWFRETHESQRSWLRRLFRR